MKVTNVEIMGIESSVKASKYPMSVDIDSLNSEITNTVKKLGHSSGGHDQMLTGITVNFDLTCTNKMWVELERYRFINFVSSQSTMHRIARMDIENQCNKYVDHRIIDIVKNKVNDYNELKNITLNDSFLKNNKWDIKTKETYNKMLKELYLYVVYNVPSGFELTARLTTNYRCLKNVYSQRKNHPLPEWRECCKWIETLPHFKEICLD